jgi:hypothetical protein
MPAGPTRWALAFAAPAKRTLACAPTIAWTDCVGRHLLLKVNAARTLSPASIHLTLYRGFIQNKAKEIQP